MDPGRMGNAPRQLERCALGQALPQFPSGRPGVGYYRKAGHPYEAIVLILSQELENLNKCN